MGAEKKKNGRPSLLDLRKRSLQLQNPNPCNSGSTPVLRSTRRNPHPGGDRIDDEEDRKTWKKRRTNAVAARDGPAARSATEKTEARISGLKGSPLVSVAGTPLPDKKLLVSIVDRLQKKDTYSVFSEPVDPNELPDYREVIEHPMDFSTVRKKLSSGAYVNLEQFENDVFLISSNAMRYNSPSTVYFRQARSIQELAKKDFENLRQDTEGNESEKVTVRRGRPPGKSSSKKAGGLPFERTSSDFSSEATLANAGDNVIWSSSTLECSRKTQLSDKPGTVDVLARNASHNGENYGWLAGHISDKNDGFPGLLMKGISKFSRKSFAHDENRRNSYKLYEQLLTGREPSVLTTFDGEKRQLMAVGGHMEHAYMRSLAQFAAKLGPIAWKVASKKIEKALPGRMKFGPGLVGEKEEPQIQFPLLSNSPLQQLSPAQSLPECKSSSHVMPHMLEPKSEKLSEKQEPPNDMSECHLRRHLPASNSTSAVASRPKHPFHPSQNPAVHSPINGFSSGHLFNKPRQLEKLVGVGPARPAGNFELEASAPSRLINMVSRSINNIRHLMPKNQSEAEDAKLLGSPSSINPTLDSSHEDQTSSGAGKGTQSSWHKSDSVPPDLNVRFQSPGSPTSAVP